MHFKYHLTNNCQPGSNTSGKRRKALVSDSKKKYKWLINTCKDVQFHTKEMQIKTIMRFHFSLTILTKIKEVGMGMKTDAHLLIPFWSK